jgi:cytochrome c oxidase cbb3-type subunit 2
MVTKAKWSPHPAMASSVHRIATSQERIMRGFNRYSFAIAASTIVANLCVVALADERAGVAFEAGESEHTDCDAIKGRGLYAAHCSACHQQDGDGLPGVFPPLKGSAVVNREDAAKHIQVVLNGMQGGKVGGVVYTSVMPPFGGALSDAEIADIINYERSTWGNHGQPVTAAQVAAQRTRSE